MNHYCRLPDLLAEISKTSAAAGDAVLLRIIGAVSRGFDGSKVLNRQVFPEFGTWYLDGDGSRELFLDFDMLAISALTVDTDGSGTYETALTEGTHFRLTPRNQPNKRRIELLRDATIAAWPEYPDSVKMVGQRGYRALSEATGQNVQNATEITSSGTTLTVTSSTGLAAGDLLIIESEEVYVTAIPGATSATIERGKNGTTAAAHANGTAISRRRYPEDIELACRLQAARMYTEARTGQSGVNADAGMGGFTFSSMYPQIRDLLHSHRNLVVH